MRKFILITAMVLVSATAQAGGSRSLTMAENETPAVAAPAKAAETPKATDATTAVEMPKAAEAPKYVDRPALVEPKPAQPAKAVAENTVSTPKAEKPRRKRSSWTAGRIIGELHRHGIYW